MPPDQMFKRTAGGRLLLYKAFLAPLWSALTAPPARCGGFLRFGVRENRARLGTEMNLTNVNNSYEK
jgi:hypothetical protein